MKTRSDPHVLPVSQRIRSRAPVSPFPCAQRRSSLEPTWPQQTDRQTPREEAEVPPRLPAQATGPVAKGHGTQQRQSQHSWEVRAARATAGRALATRSVSGHPKPSAPTEDAPRPPGTEWTRRAARRPGKPRYLEMTGNWKPPAPPTAGRGQHPGVRGGAGGGPEGAATLDIAPGLAEDRATWVEGRSPQEVKAKSTCAP